MDWLISSLSVGYVLLAWFKTDVFVMYAKLFRLTRFFKVQEFLDSQTLYSKEPLGKKLYANYLEYIRDKYGSTFLGKLITCPVCLAFWISLFICALSPLLTLAVAFLGTFIYFWCDNFMRRSHE